LAEHVEETDGVRGRAQRAVHDRCGEEDSPPLVLSRAVGEEELGRGVVVDLDPEGREEIVGLVEDTGDEGVVEEADAGTHG
jgi:hypothetical protein